MRMETQEEEAPEDISPKVFFSYSFHIWMSYEITHHRLRVY